ncbi:Very short patch repair protein [Thalassoglobus neptunius]|uniref:Very short patch repair endonuclease n=1 Tax=Thalassoglobus neptunius TaxID=1938619 RepID=A0A5C5VP26_9PLAN|nr:DNA mismatch endonuclease Vsr [Thalassoglobus neptunius]TWT39850.1 Very short patch repair protein [Thalassoglobus neptunius]
MADRITKERRSWNMAQIRDRDTKPEIAVRSMLHRLGFRFRLHRSDLPGNPDIVLAKYKTVVLVHGCFWHRHRNCKYAYTPKSRTEFWEVKFARNVERDLEVRRELCKLGWQVVVVWQCQLAKPDMLAERLLKIREGV